MATEPFEEDAGLPSERAKAQAAKLAVRDQVIALFAFKRGNGEGLVDSAIAARLGIKPSEVAAIRAEYAQAQRLAELATLATPDGPIRRVEEPRKEEPKKDAGHAAAVYAHEAKRASVTGLHVLLDEARIRLRLANNTHDAVLGVAAEQSIAAVVAELKRRGLPVPPEEAQEAVEPTPAPAVRAEPAAETTPEKPKRVRKSRAKKAEPEPEREGRLTHMTRQELLDNFHAATPAAGRDYALREHEATVRLAVAAGKDVPERVLAEYPDLLTAAPATCPDCNGVGGHWGQGGQNGKGRCPTCGLLPHDEAEHAPELVKCPACGALDQRRGYYCTSPVCGKFVPYPPDADPEDWTPAEHSDLTTGPALLTIAPGTLGVEAPTLPDHLRPVADRTPGSSEDAASLAERPARKPPLYDLHLWGLTCWEVGARHELELLQLVEAVRGARQFYEAKLAGTGDDELARLDGAERTRGLLLRLWGWIEDARDHAPLYQFASYVRGLLQMEEELITEAEGK